MVRQMKGVRDMGDEMFKTTLMGGFDKDDVLAKVQNMKDDAYAERSKLLKEGRAKDKKIAELERRVSAKEQEKKQAAEEASQRLKAEREKMQEQLMRKDAEVRRKLEEMQQRLLDKDKENQQKIEEVRKQHVIEMEGLR